MEGVQSASINLANESLRIYAEDGIGDAIIKQAEKIVHTHEPHVRFQPVISGTDTPEQNQSTNQDEGATSPFGLDMLHWNLGRIIVSLSLFLVSFLVQDPWTDGILIIAYVLSGYQIIGTALRNLTRGLVFDENFLMTLATIGAFAIRQPHEAVGIMVFYMIGEYFQDLAVHRSRRSIKDLLNIRPDYAMVLVDGEPMKVNPESVEVEDIILVRPGERVPLDGIILEGYSQLDTRALTGDRKSVV